MLEILPRSEISFVIEGANACSTPNKTAESDTLSSGVVEQSEFTKTVLATKAGKEKLQLNQSEDDNCLEKDEQ